MIKKIKFSLLFCIAFFIQKGYSQTVELSGLVTAKSNLEGIHVVNKTSQYYTTTSIKGVFLIKAKVNDTLVFSSVQYKLLAIKIIQETIDKKSLNVELIEHINQLDEVLVGNTLTGNLADDINSVEGEPEINFYDVGIPGYTGKQKTQSERRLYEAGEFKPKMLLGLLVGNVPLNPILNGISGRTKELKNRVKLEANAALMYHIKAKFSKDLFFENSLEVDKQMDYFYFCSEDEKFMETCNSNNDLLILDYLKEKLVQYKLNLQSKD